MKKQEIDRLVDWYRLNKRILPFRDTDDPYDVWISEIMLQQTRIEAAVSYFLRFKKEILDIDTLAGVDEDRLLRLWEGLGYYSRARNLKKCAQILKEEHQGKIPEEHDALLKLPGIGPYTAGAILAIGFGKPYPAIDGNVLRVLARYLGITEDIRSDAVRKKLEIIVSTFYKKEEINDKQYVRDLTQSFMELGAMVCIPNGKPLCMDCPLRKNCYACQNGLTDQIPYRSKPKERKIIERTLFIIRIGDKFLLTKRPKKGLLAGMYEFMGIDQMLNERDVETYLKERGLIISKIMKLPSSKHIFSHVEWHMDAYEISIADGDIPLVKEQILVSKDQLQELAIPSAFKTYIDYYALREGEHL
ncbi:MAG: A/G-specific adenine glycosylase [Erysipelotrichaceae bacterium]|nr:A/G-specific adenine glycosylase [Erysipelotrichaceae bacterium]